MNMSILYSGPFAEKGSKKIKESQVWTMLCKCGVWSVRFARPFPTGYVSSGPPSYSPSLLHTNETSIGSFKGWQGVGKWPIAGSIF
jgi:hypothetical protein